MNLDGFDSLFNDFQKQWQEGNLRRQRGKVLGDMAADGQGYFINLVPY